MRYGIIGALDEEIALVKEQMTEVKEHKLYGRSFYTGRIGKKEIVLVCCGVGKVTQRSLPMRSYGNSTPRRSSISVLPGLLARALE